MHSRTVARKRELHPPFHHAAMETWDEPHRRCFKLTGEERWFPAAVGVQEDRHPHSRPVLTSVAHRAFCGLGDTMCSK